MEHFAFFTFFVETFKYYKKRVTSKMSFRCLYCWLWAYFTPCICVSAVNFEQETINKNAFIYNTALFHISVILSAAFIQAAAEKWMVILQYPNQNNQKSLSLGKGKISLIFYETSVFRIFINCWRFHSCLMHHFQ